MDHVDAWLGVIGAWGYGLLGAACLLEYVLPIFPGDVVTVAGGAWVAREERSVALLFAALSLGSLLGLSAMWGVGRAFAKRVEALPDGATFVGVKVEQLRRVQQLMVRRSTVLLLGNRFMPGLRSVVLLSAGAAGVPYGKVLVLGSISAAVFNGILVFAGVTIGDNAEALATFFSRFRIATLSFLALVIIAFCASWLWRRRRG